MLIWHGEKVMKALRNDARTKVRKTILLVEKDIKMSMRLGGRTESGMLEGKGSKRVDPVTGRKADRINTFRSKPGEVPRVQTGVLRRSITHEMHDTLPIGRVGTNVEYSKWLEFGTRRMKPRPFIRPSLMRVIAPIRTIWSVPIRTIYSRPIKGAFE
jgi:phage gpG-like protein